MIEKARQDLEKTSDHQTNQSGQWKRSLHKSQGEPRGERDVIRLRNPTEDKKAFRRMLTSADPFSWFHHVTSARKVLFYRDSRACSENFLCQ